MRNKTRPAGIAMVGLGLLATLLFLAGPAAAGSLGADATDGSVTSGSARADDGSTASGDAEASDGSVSSGCATADDDSTASGGDCHAKPDHHKPDHHKPAHHGKKHHAGVGGASPAHAVGARSLAVTGSTTGPLAAAAAGLLALGALMVVLTSDRRRASIAA